MLLRIPVVLCSKLGSGVVLGLQCVCSVHLQIWYLTILASAHLGRLKTEIHASDERQVLVFEANQIILEAHTTNTWPPVSSSDNGTSR